jgi:phosphoenolpyruvate phosphomutase
LHNLLDWDAELLVAVDSSPLSTVSGNINDLAWCSAPDNRAMYQQKVSLVQVSSNNLFEGMEADGRWIGMLRVAGRGGQYLRSALNKLKQRDDFNTLGIPDLLNQLVKDGHAPQVQYVTGHWMDINNLADLERAGGFEKTTGD